MARVMLAHLGMLPTFGDVGTLPTSTNHQRGNGSPCGGYWKPSGSVGTLGGDQTSTNHGATFRGQCWNTVQHHGGNLRDAGTVGRIKPTNQHQPRGKCIPLLQCISPFRNPQNAPLPTTGQPSRDAANVREIKPAFSTNGAIFGAILAHSPHVVGCIY